MKFKTTGAVNETALKNAMTNVGIQDPFWGKQFSSLYGFCKSAIIGLLQF